MSGDLGPRVVIAAALELLESTPGLELILIGDQNQLKPLLALAQTNPIQRLRLHHAPDTVSMSDDPLVALRHKKTSSMWVALELVRDGLAQACVSAGNTGALMAMSRHLIKTLPGIDRPAICKSMPVAQGRSFMLDLGANIECSAEQLQQFAHMGSVLAMATGIAEPRVALLNIGVEETKGTDKLQAAHRLLGEDKRLNYAGFIEASEIFTGCMQVIVCDGFSGNVALKASEGVARLIGQKLKDTFQRNLWRRLLAFCAWPLLRQLSFELNPAGYNGASFLGLHKIVVKSHGSADQQAFIQALRVAVEQVSQAIPERIAAQL